ncbi:MAG: CRP/FNR family transcriptional regulator [Saprospiraceae bacterium]|jgi:CRP/FNR family transcriptional regulator
MSTTTERNKALLNEHFPQLNDLKLIEEMAEAAVEYNFKEGQVIIDYGENIRMVPLVIKGSIKVMREDDDGNELFLYYLNGGEACATSFTCCMTSKKSYMKTIAEDETKVLGLPLKKVDDWISEFRVWKNFVMQAYDSRILEMVHTLDSIAFMRMDERLIKYLEETAAATKSNIISNTHQQIANDLNASREAVSRLLKSLEQKNKIKLSRNRIELLDISS